MNKIFLLLISLFVSSSCTVYGVTDDYRKLSEEQQQKVVPLVAFTETNNNHIYKVNGKQLREEIQKHPRALVYTFTNGCKSEYCLPMSTYEKYARDNGYQLFLVMQGFGNLNETVQQRSPVFTAPLYAMDADYYNSRFSWNFSKYFENDLRAQPRKTKNEWLGSLYFFENGELVKVARGLNQ